MNEDILKGKWRQILGEVKMRWGRLTDNDLKRIEGSTEKLSGLLQERYGITKQEAHTQIANFLETIEARIETRLEKTKDLR